MKKFFSYLLSQIKYFIINPFWKQIPILILIFLTIILNGLIWFLYITRYREILDYTPIIYSSTVLILNLLLSNIIFQKKSLFAYIFLVIALIIQLFFLYFLQIISFTGGVF